MFTARSGGENRKDVVLDMIDQDFSWEEFIRWLHGLRASDEGLKELTPLQGIAILEYIGQNGLPGQKVPCNGKVVDND